MISNKSRGSALLTALFIMTLVAIIMTAMTAFVRQNIYQTVLGVSYTQNVADLDVVNAWAMNYLQDKNHDLNHLKKGKVARLPKSLQGFIPGVKLEGEIIDGQSKFNLNNLQDNMYFSIFVHLIKNTLPSLSEKHVVYIVGATHLWIMAYQPGRGADDLVKYYLSQHPPYSMSHQPMRQISEFRLIFNVDKAIYDTLTPYLIVLPEKAPINLYTARKALLKSLGNNLTSTQLSRLLQTRQDTSLPNKIKMMQLIKQFNIPPAQVSLSSDYFLVKAKITTDAMSLSSDTLYKREVDKKKHLTLKLISRNFY